MATAVQLRDLGAAMRERGDLVYVLTVSERATPHVVRAEIRWDDQQLIAVVGTRTAGHARARPELSLLFPARHRDDYSLIVDAMATAVGGAGSAELALTPTRGVLHRPGPAPDPTT